MTRTVFCRKYKKDLEGLEQPPIPGPKGLDLFENVSKQAWQDWLTHQTLLINEKHLNMMDMTARTYLQGQMKKFFSGEAVDKADGFVAPTDDDKD